ncbi:thiamine pyrophosphokinase [Sporothrix curviconia]|uniref:Thiamine pyrophosphokinase n=1 Tax=Sporothrix curviconia TaxID=1260050 RepID=A0ABP0AUA3_9PEZI
MTSAAAGADTPAYEWFPARLLQQKPRFPAKPYAAVVLNQPLGTLEPMQRVWQSSKFRVAADGGANQLHDILKASDLDFKDLDVIVGDLDSLQAPARQYFEAEEAGHATEVIHDSDQYSTDFTKAVKLVRDRVPGVDVVALGGLGGRVDQGVSQLHHLYLFDEPRRELFSGAYRMDWSDDKGPHGRTFLLTSDSLTFLLLPGHHRIHVREQLGDEDVFAKHIGILPMQGPSVITTKGLEWDITDWPTEFGGQMSTSNHVLPETLVVEVQTNRSIVFTIALKEAWQSK